MATTAWTPLTLPNGKTFKNRITKAAMEENMANQAKYNQPSNDMIRLYSTWANGGFGAILSGHIMIDPTAVGCPANVILAKDVFALQDEEVWKTFIDAGRQNGTKFLLQINHPGRQAKKGTGLPCYGASPIAVNIGAGSSTIFDVPIEMSDENIQEVISRFAWTAEKSEELGADGVEIHAAHGYLISSFLSPSSNRRQDRWGGSMENRARLLFEVIRAVKKSTNPGFIVGVKINSADFQRGGFQSEDLRWVVEHLNDLGLDFIELSGGSFESPTMMGKLDERKESKKTASTRSREAYFLRTAQELYGVAKMPIMVTGGISSKEILQTVVETSHQVLAGIGTAAGIVPDIPKRWESGENITVTLPDSWVLPRSLTYAARNAQVQSNLVRIGAERQAIADVWPCPAFLWQRWVEKSQFRQYKAWLHAWLA
jgi:2,4-dienoyl-CoA reductase-like NADH-dependent reductase (Old Yellow Enzyme family)